MKSVVLFVLFTLASLLVVSNSYAAENYRYKWKSSDGEIHYSDRPPAAGIEFERIRVVGKESQSSSVSSSFQKPSKPTEEKEDSYQGWRKDNCKIATQNLDILQNSGRIAKDDGQGGTRLMTDEEKAEQIKKMQAQSEKYCSDANDANKEK